MKYPLRLALFGAAILAASVAGASTPVEVFRQVLPSVLVLEVLDAEGKSAAALTAVALADGRAVTMCDSINGAKALQIVSDKGPLPAKVSARDSRRNLCLLSVPGLEQPGLSRRVDSKALLPGSHVFAVSNALGLGIGISEGVVSGLRTESAIEYIQHTASVSPGSEGGALVDEKGRLLGIILYRQRDGQNVNFAIPSRSSIEIEREDEVDRAYGQLQERAELLAREGRWDALATHAEKWSAQHSDDPEAWRWLALAANRLNDSETEERSWQTLHRLEPASTTAGAGLVRALLRRGKDKAALELAHSLLALRQEDAEVWTAVGAAEQAAGTMEAAEAALSKAVSLNPWSIDAHERLAHLAEQRGDLAGVTAVWRGLAHMYPDDPGIRFRLVLAYIREGHPARAYAMLEHLGTDAQNADTLLLKGTTLKALGRPVDAIRAYRRSLEGNPSSRALVQASLGDAYLSLQRFPEAIATFREAVRLDPQKYDWQYQLAIALKDGGHAEEAATIDRKLVEKYPKNASAWRQLGFVSAVLGRHSESIRSLEHSLDLEPRQGKVWAALMDQYHAAGRLDDARKAYEKLQSVDAQWAAKAYRETLLPYEEAKR